MIKPRVIFGTADLIGNESTRFVESVFEAPFYDQFGCAEIDRAAWQCQEKEGYHIDADSVIVQFVDNEGNEVSSGEEGEVVYTSLFSYAQPFIRYAIKDIGRPLDDDCSCGIKLPLMKVVEGRKDSFLVLPAGRLLAPMGFWTIMRYFKYAESIERFRVVQEKPGRIEIVVKKNGRSPLSDDFLQNELVRHIAKCLHVGPNEGLSVNIAFVEELPLDKSGKLRSVVSTLPNKAG
jgi:phenylacetate-CoA ligase